jgi:hypothetical protein
MTSQTAAQLRVHRWGWVVLAILVFGVLVSASEGIVRLAGFKAFRVNSPSIEVNPGGKWFMKHPTLGYSQIPGKFIVTLGSRYSFNVTHLPNTLRITHPIDGYLNKDKQKEEIWIFGCSFTHGWGLNDEETYPWLLQERFPEYEIVNFGVGGYGTIHSLIQFQEALEVKTPKLAVLAYASFHDKRNTFMRNRKKQVQLTKQLGPVFQPYALLDSQGRLQYSFADVEYREFPLMRYSALVHFIENLYNDYEEIRYRSHAVSEALVAEMEELAKKRGVKFVVAGINERPETSEMLAFAQSHGISNVNISVDLDVNENTLKPHDEHPSATANKKYADKLETFLRAEPFKSMTSAEYNPRERSLINRS